MPATKLISRQHRSGMRSDHMIECLAERNQDPRKTAQDTKARNKKREQRSKGTLCSLRWEKISLRDRRQGIGNNLTFGTTQIHSIQKITNHEGRDVTCFKCSFRINFKKNNTKITCGWQRCCDVF